MSTQINPSLQGALLLGFAISLAGCDSALITGTGSDGLEIGAAQAAPTLLQDGEFENGANAWESCSTNGASELVSDASRGSMALQVANGACRYQNVNADATVSYKLTCDAKTAADRWSTVTLAFLDQSLDPLESREIAIESNTYQNYEVTMTAPEFTSKAEVLFYSDDTTTVDNCTLAEVSVSVPQVTLQNGSFTDDLSNWSQCASENATAANGTVTLGGGSCINQIVDVTAAVAATPVNTPLTLSLRCDQINKTGDQYAATIIAFLDENNAPLANAEQSIVAATTATAVNLSAPAGSVSAEVMIYSDAQTAVGQCSLVAIN